MPASSGRSIHPGPYIREHVIPEGVSVKEAAELLVVGQPALSNLLNGNASLSPKMAMRLEKAFTLKAANLMEIQARYARDETQSEGAATTTKSFVPAFLQIKSNELEAWSGSIDA